MNDPSDSQPVPSLRQPPSDPADLAALYDDWSERYDDDLEAWGYRVPHLAATALANVQPGQGPVLDIGCGTGLVGRQLAGAGFGDLVGIDLSERSLALVGQTSLYRSLHQLDVARQQIPFDDDTFAAAVCIGVMTYLPDTANAVREFARVVEPRGSILFTQRQDAWAERDDHRAIEALADQGVCTVESISEPLPYLPNNAEMGDVPARLIHLRSGRDSTQQGS